MSKIAIFTYSIYTVGGEQRVVSLLANELVKKHDITIFTMDSSKSTNNIFNISEDVKVRYYHPYQGDIISFIYRIATHTFPKMVYDVFPSMLERAYCAPGYVDLMNELIDDSYDVVIATAWQLSILLGKVKEKYNRSYKAIAWEHNSYEAYFEEKYFYLYKHEQLFTDAMHHVDYIVVLNDDYKTKYEEKLGLNSIVIYNPKTFESEEKAELISKRFVACSRIDEKQKGIDLLLEAFRLFCRDNSEWTLTIAGDGPMLNKYKALASEYGIADRVDFVGRTNKVKELLLSASVFVLPSRFEGFPMSVTEAFEVGLPVLAFDIPAMIPFKEAGGAVTVDSFDINEYSKQMLCLADDYNIRSTLGQKGIEFAKGLSTNSISEEWENILSK